MWGYGQLKMTWGILNLVNGHGSSGGVAWRRYVDQVLFLINNYPSPN